MNEYLEIIENYTNIFLEAMKEHAEFRFGKGYIWEGNFPLLNSNNSAFHEQFSFEGRIEDYTRRFLINMVFRAFFKVLNTHNTTIEIKYSESSRFSWNTDTKDIEREYPVEFILTKNGNRIGYRYTTPPLLNSKLMNPILKRYNLTKLFIIDFSVDKESTFLSETYSIPRKYENTISYITLEDFFKEYFPIGIYDIYLSKTRQVIQEAYDYIGIQTIPNLTLSY